MTETKHAPTRIFATVNGTRTSYPSCQTSHIGGWSSVRDSDRAVEYVPAAELDRLRNSHTALVAALREARRVIESTKTLNDPRFVDQTNCMAAIDAALSAEGEKDAPKDDVATAPFGWKCNCCTTVFTDPQEHRRENDNNGGPNCPRCKAFGQYTYRYELHDGDPCVGCGTPHDEVNPGPCRAPKDDGWIEWKGGEEPPVDYETKVDVRFRDGHESLGGNGWYWGGMRPGEESSEIVAYRVVKP